MIETREEGRSCEYGGLGPSEVRRMKQLEEENHRLKRLVADLSLDKRMLQDVLAKKLRSLPGSERLPTICNTVLVPVSDRFADHPNQVWGMDFVSDALFDGRRLRLLTIVDLCTRECLVSWSARVSKATM